MTVADLRTLVLAYRTIAELAVPDECARVDALARQLGETWLIPHEAYPSDELITRMQAAEIMCIKPNSMTQAAKRHQLKKYVWPGTKQKRYRAGDIYRLQAQIYGRRGK